VTEGSSQIWIRILSGSRTGIELTFRDTRVAIGRHPECQLRFDPGQDLQVSARHAAFVRGPTGWTVEDLGSRNGTFLNGSPIGTPQLLADGDEIRLGADGPLLEISLTGLYSPRPKAQGGVTTQRIRAAVATQTSRLRAVLAVTSVAAVTVVAGTFWARERDRQRWATDRDSLTGQVDSLLRVTEAPGPDLEAVVSVLADSLQSAREEAQGLRDRLAAIPPPSTQADSREVDELRRRLQDALVRLERQQLAASLDFEEIRRRTEPAVAMIWSEWSDGTVSTGTALSIESGGLLLTNRHVVEGPGGPGRRLAVQFAGSSQVWRGTLVDTHEEVDLGWVRTEGIVGQTPVLDRFNHRLDTLAMGSPVAIVGFPHGGRPGTDAPGARRRAVVSAGVLLGSSDVEIRIQGYGAEGASGSPVVDRDGQVIGLVYGATLEDGGEVLLAVPIAWADRRP